MERREFDAYISRFNAEDPSAFDDYLAPDMLMLNGALEFRGVAGMREHYQNKIWPFFIERIHILQYVGSESVVAVQMWTNFRARSRADTLFGPVVPDEQFDYRGLIMYELVAGKFSKITVAYNSFSNTKPSGQVIALGIPH